jgi:nucleoside-diphosphate-sugar epimerase
MEAHSKEKVFITGISGFTGKHIEEVLLNAGYLVYGTTFSMPKENNHFKCDILSKEEISSVLKRIQPDYVIHLAAISFVASDNVPNMYETNILGTLNLLETLDNLRVTPKKIIIASSAAVYGNIGSILSEDMCPKPVNHYGNSKMAMENMVSNFYDKFNIIITRPFNYTGIGQESNFLVPKIVSHFKDKKDFIELGNLYTYREYNDVRFLSKVYLELMNRDFNSGVVNISSAVTHKINDILEIMENISSHSIEVRVNNNFVRKNEIKELKGSSEKLKGILGMKISAYSLEEILKEMYFN